MNAFSMLLSACLPNGHKAPISYDAVIRTFRVNVSTEICREITYVCSNKTCNQKLSKLMDVCTNAACLLEGRKQHASGYLRFLVQPQVESVVRKHYTDISNH